MFFWKTPAQRAGKKAGRAWLNMSERLDEDVETLTGRELLAHAKEEARKWLRSEHYIEGAWSWQMPEYREPEQKHHSEFLEYVEAFISAFPPISRGYPKE